MEYQWRREGESVLFWQEGGAYVLICPLRENMVSCKASAGLPYVREDALLKEGGAAFSSVCQRGGRVCMRLERLQVQFSLRDGEIRYYSREGALLHENGRRQLWPVTVMRYSTGGEEPEIEKVMTVDGERSFVRNLREEPDHTAYRGRYYFRWQEQEGIYGLGQGEDGVFNHRGRSEYLYQHNMRIPMPVFYSDRGYGMIFDCGCLMTFEGGGEEAYLYFDALAQLEYVFAACERADEFVEGIRYLTGNPSMLPAWAYGYIQSKEQYYTADELEQTVREYRRRGIPLDGIVQDWNTWEPGLWGEKSLDRKRYGNMKEVAERLKAMHAHAMVSVWPNMNQGGKNHREFLERGMLLGDNSTYNAFDEKARDVYWQQAARGLMDQGFEAWWCDSTEPFTGPDWNGECRREEWERFTLVGNEHRKYLGAERANLFALAHAKGIYENQRREREDIRVLNLTRSGYLSGYRYGAVLWSGDICAGWDTLRKQVAEGLSMSLSGYPYWTLDIGGFFTVRDKWQNRGCGCSMVSEPKWFWQGEYEEGVQDMGYRELYTRWLQLGVFLPMFRSHGTDTPREIWNFGEEGDMFYDSIARFIRLRYRLLPHIYSLAADVCFRSATFMRGLLFDFCKDARARGIKDEFLFGTSLLVCPVLEPLYFEREGAALEKPKLRSCYLPDSALWYDFWTNHLYEGGCRIDARATIDRMPVFVKGGSLIPMAEGLQYADGGWPERMELHLYTGEDAHYILYEDEGNGYGYERGLYSEIGLHWSEEKALLTIDARRGAYPGMKSRREFLLYKNGILSDTIVYEGDEILREL